MFYVIDILGVRRSRFLQCLLGYVLILPKILKSTHIFDSVPRNQEGLDLRTLVCTKHSKGDFLNF